MESLPTRELVELRNLIICAGLIIESSIEERECRSALQH